LLAEDVDSRYPRESCDSVRAWTKRNVDRDFVSLSTVFRNPVTGSLADRPRALIREPVNPTDRKIGAFLRSGHPHFRRAVRLMNLTAGRG